LGGQAKSSRPVSTPVLKFYAPVSSLPGKHYLYFEIPDHDVKLEDLKTIVYHLIKYEKIIVFNDYNLFLVLCFK